MGVGIIRIFLNVQYQEYNPKNTTNTNHDIYLFIYLYFLNIFGWRGLDRYLKFNNQRGWDMSFVKLKNKLAGETVETREYYHIF